MFQFACYNKFVFKFAKLFMIQLLFIHKGCPGSIPIWYYIQGLSLTILNHMGFYRDISDMLDYVMLRNII